MDKFNLSKISENILNNNSNLFRDMESDNKKTMEAISKNNREKIEREKRSIELQETIVNQNDKALSLQELEVDFLKNMSEDTSQIVNLIKSLETINSVNGKISASNMLEIQETLERLVENTNSESIYELFMNEVKLQLVEKGVSYGMQFLFTGLKTLLAAKLGTNISN